MTVPIWLLAGQRAASAWAVEQIPTRESIPSRPGGLRKAIEPNSSASPIPVREIVTVSGLKAPARVLRVPAVKEGSKEEAARAVESETQ